MQRNRVPISCWTKNVEG